MPTPKWRIAIHTMAVSEVLQRDAYLGVVRGGGGEEEAGRQSVMCVLCARDFVCRVRQYDGLVSCVLIFA